MIHLLLNLFNDESITISRSHELGGEMYKLVGRAGDYRMASYLPVQNVELARFNLIQHHVDNLLSALRSKAPLNVVTK